MPMSRLSCVHLQTFVRSAQFCAYKSRLLFIQQIFVRSCSDFHAFFDVSRLCKSECMTSPPPAFIVWSKISCVHVPTIVRSGQDFVRSCRDILLFMFRLSCVLIQTFVRLTDFDALMSRLSCSHQFSFRFSVLDWLSSKQFYRQMKSQCISTCVDIIFLNVDNIWHKRIV